MSRFIYGLAIIAPSRAAGNALFASFSDHEGDAHAFDNAMPLYPPGTVFTPLAFPRPGAYPTANQQPTGFYLYVPIIEEKYQQALAIRASVEASGFKVDIGARADVEARWSQFIADNGYIAP